MRKITDLTNWLEKCVPDLARDPENLFINAVSGTAVARSGGPSFEYRCKVEITLLDLPFKNLDAVIVGLIFWLQLNQPELIENKASAEDVLSYRLEMLNSDTCDFGCDLALTELVSVLPKNDAAGSYDIIHRAEPDRDRNFDALIGMKPAVRLRTLYLGEDLLLEVDD